MGQRLAKLTLKLDINVARDHAARRDWTAAASGGVIHNDAGHRALVVADAGQSGHPGTRTRDHRRRLIRQAIAEEIRL